MNILITTPANNIPYLFAAYAVAWAILFGYLFFLSRHQQELKREVESVKQGLSKLDGSTQDKPLE